MAQYVFVKFGADGKQIAEVLGELPGVDQRLRVRKWRQNSKKWTDPTVIHRDKVLGSVPEGDPQLKKALGR